MSDPTPSPNRWPLITGVLLLALVIVGGVILRFAALDRRMMHHDEANQAVRCEPLITRGEYHYDPFDHHGPTLYYLAAPILRLGCGTDFAACTERLLRSVTAAVGVLVILLIWPLRRALGTGGAIAAMACVALSPGLVYYSRFFIQEMLLVAATIALLASVWRYAERPSVPWAVAMGAAAGLMLATKETAVLTFAALAVAALAVLWRRWRPVAPHVACGVAAGTVVLAVFYSSLGSHWEGLTGLVRAIPYYLNRAGGGGHSHGVSFYLEPLARYEWPLLILAAIGVVAAFTDRSASPAALFRRGLAITALVLTGFYLAIPYKTPWCLMTSLALFAICAGHGVAALAGQVASRRGLAVWCATVLLLAPLAVIAHRLSFVTMSDVRNRWGYVETSRDLRNLVDGMHGLAALAPEGYAMTVAVVAPAENIWPLPWYLRRFSRVGYWNDPLAVPLTLVPAVVIGDPEATGPVAERIPGEPVNKLFGLRSEVFLSLDCPADLWRRMVAARPPQRR